MLDNDIAEITITGDNLYGSGRTFPRRRMRLTINAVNTELLKKIFQASFFQRICEDVVELYIGEDSDIASLPEEIGRLLSLRKLVICSDGNMTHLPTAITQCRCLTEIFILPNHVFVNFPQELRLLTNLSKVHISCDIAEIPHWISELTQLERIDLLTRRIPRIPASFAHMTHLSCLTLSPSIREANDSNAMLSDSLERFLDDIAHFSLYQVNKIILTSGAYEPNLIEPFHQMLEMFKLHEFIGILVNTARTVHDAAEIFQAVLSEPKLLATIIIGSKDYPKLVKLMQSTTNGLTEQDAAVKLICHYQRLFLVNTGRQLKLAPDTTDFTANERLKAIHAFSKK